MSDNVPGSVRVESPLPPEFPPALSRYLGARVTIHYNQQSGVSDTGKVLYIDHHWVELSKGDDRLLIPTTAIRIVKLLEPGHMEEQSTFLLRPAGEPNDENRALPK